MDTKEADFVAQYASDLGLCIYAWNCTISTMFLPFVSACRGKIEDPQKLWFSLNSDRARLEKLLKEARSTPFDADALSELIWFVERLLAVIGYRNAISHLGLRYFADSVAPDPYGKEDQQAIVEHFLRNPADLANLVGDLRVLGQYGDDIAIRAMFPGSIALQHQMRRPTLMFIPD